MAKAEKSDDAQAWIARKALIQTMHKIAIQRDEGRDMDEYERNVVEGLWAMAHGKFDESYRWFEMAVRTELDPYALAIAGVDEKRGIYRRIYSSCPDKFPVTDDMPLPNGPWTDTVVQQLRIFVSNKLTTAAAIMPDSAEGLAMGCQCICYMPIAVREEDDEILYVLIFLGKRNFFTDENVQALSCSYDKYWNYMNSLRMARKYESPGPQSPKKTSPKRGRRLRGSDAP